MRSLASPSIKKPSLPGARILAAKSAFIGVVIPISHRRFPSSVKATSSARYSSPSTASSHTLSCISRQLSPATPATSPFPEGSVGTKPALNNIIELSSDSDTEMDDATESSDKDSEPIFEGDGEGVSWFKRKTSKQDKDDDDYRFPTPPPFSPTKERPQRQSQSSPPNKPRRSSSYIGELVRIKDGQPIVGQYSRAAWKARVGPKVAPYKHVEVANKLRQGKSVTVLEKNRFNHEKFSQFDWNKELEARCAGLGLDLPSSVVEMLELGYLASRLGERALVESAKLKCWQLPATREKDMDFDALHRPKLTMNDKRLYRVHVLPQFHPLIPDSGIKVVTLQHYLDFVHNSPNSSNIVAVPLHRLALRFHPPSAELTRRLQNPATYSESSHCCHNPRCFNPKHVFPETPQENLGRSQCVHRVNIVDQQGDVIASCYCAQNTDRPPCTNPKKKLITKTYLVDE